MSRMALFSLFFLALIPLIPVLGAEEKKEEAAAKGGESDDFVDLFPYLEGASKEQVEEFKKLVGENKSKQPKEVEAAVDAWVEKQGEPIKTKYAAFKKEAGGSSA